MSTHHPGPRIVVVGTSGAGKTTLARSLATKLDCPHIELDALYWGPNWTPQSTPHFQRVVTQATETSTWVADGNYRAVREQLWSSATAIVWLNYSFPRVFWQALRRSLHRSVSGKPLWHGNRETIQRTFFSRDSILRWVVKTYRPRRREIEVLRRSDQFPGLRWIELRDPRDTQRWLAQVSHADLSHTRSTATHDDA